MNEQVYRAVLHRLDVETVDVTVPALDGRPLHRGDAEVGRRAQVFREQITEWTASGRYGVPTLVLPDAPSSPSSGQCISCGTPVGDGWRCNTCIRAVRQALSEA